MKIYETLYTRNSNKAIQQWEINVTEEETGFSIIRIYEGLKDGKQSVTSNTITKGKNLLKMNETSPFEQACSQALSKWTKKKKQGYKSLTDLGITSLSDLELALPENRTDANGAAKPMKAQNYFKDDGSVRISFPCYGQPKLNGFRCTASWEEILEGEGLFTGKTEKVIFRSKEGLQYNILDHIANEFDNKMFMYNGVPLIFDGEMYIHGEILSEISSAVRKRNPKTLKLQFNIFDLAIENESQKNRIDVLNWLQTQISTKKINNIKVVPTVIINSNEEAQIYTDNCIKQGYEGAVFRDMKAIYRFGSRPTTMVKLKRFSDKEFKIIDVVGGENSPELGVFICLAENGKTFKCTPEGTKELKTEYLSNKQHYIGGLLTVRFFERTKDNLPFHAIGVTVRDYE